MLFVTKLMLYPHTALEAARLLLKDNKLPALAAFVANFDHESSTPEQVAAPTPPVLSVKLDDHSAEDVLETVEENVVANADSSSSNVSPITVKRWRMDIRRTKSHEVDHYNFLAPPHPSSRYCVPSHHRRFSDSSMISFTPSSTSCCSVILVLIGVISVLLFSL